MSGTADLMPDFLVWRCANCGAAAQGKKKPCDCVTNVGTRKGPNGHLEQTWWDQPESDLEATLSTLQAELERLRQKGGEAYALADNCDADRSKLQAELVEVKRVADSLGEMACQRADELIAAESSLAQANERVKELEGALADSKRHIIQQAEANAKLWNEEYDRANTAIARTIERIARDLDPLSPPDGDTLLNAIHAKIETDWPGQIPVHTRNVILNAAAEAIRALKTAAGKE